MNWIAEIGDLRFDYADRDIFAHEDAGTRALALQKYFFPQLGRLLAGANALVKEVYGDDALRGLTRKERPRPKGGRYAVSRFEYVGLGLTGERNHAGLKFKKPNGDALQYGVSSLWFEVHQIGTIRVQFIPLQYGVDEAATKAVAKLFESSLGALEAISLTHFICNSASMQFELLDDFAKHPLELVTAGTYFPADAESGLCRLVLAFAALFPWFRAITDLSVGNKPTLEQDLEKYMNAWEEFGPPYLFPEMVEGITRGPSADQDADAVSNAKVISAPVLRDRRRWQVFVRDDFKCVNCGKTSHDGVQLEVDHKLPRSQGGTDEIDNLQVLCRICNSGKSDTSSHDLTKAARRLHAK